MTSISLICLKVVKRGGLVINHSLRSHTSGVSVIFYFLLYMLQNKQSHTHSLCSVMSRCIICISNNVDYHSLYSILNFHWLIYLQITVANTLLSMRTLKMIRQLQIKISFFLKMSTWFVLLSYYKANCPLHLKKRMQKHQKSN